MLTDKEIVAELERVMGKIHFAMLTKDGKQEREKREELLRQALIKLEGIRITLRIR